MRKKSTKPAFFLSSEEDRKIQALAVFIHKADAYSAW